MSGEFEDRPAEILGGLDAVGNSTKAITKGMAIATAVLAATSLFGSFAEAVLLAMNRAGQSSPIDDRPSGCARRLLLGGSVAFLFSSLAIRAVGRAAMRVVVEVRNQFRDHPGIMDYTEKPDYGRVVDICTRTSLRELTTPGLLAVLSPVIAGFFLGAEGLGAFLAGSILTGQLLAVMLSNSGGAWDNAKKFIEEGHYGGKGSESHTAAVIGDTVGDPFKDTAGPALNPLIKVMNLVALLIAPIVVAHVGRYGDPRGGRRDRGGGARVDDLGLEVEEVRARGGDQGSGRRRERPRPDVGILRRLLDRLNESDETRLAAEVRGWADSVEGTVRIADAALRQPVRDRRRDPADDGPPAGGKEALQVLLSDGTGEVSPCSWAGAGSAAVPRQARRGRGVLGEQRGDVRMVNPGSSSPASGSAHAAGGPGGAGAPWSVHDPPPCR